MARMSYDASGKPFYSPQDWDRVQAENTGLDLDNAKKEIEIWNERLKQGSTRTMPPEPSLIDVQERARRGYKNGGPVSNRSRSIRPQAGVRNYAKGRE